jgi:hypothetical protein
MDKKNAISVFLLVTLFLSAVGNASAQTSLVGVSQGNTFKYNLTFYWNSTNSDVDVPWSLVEQNQTDYFQLTVQTATGTTVQFVTIWRFLNGTEVNGTELAEVGSGSTGSIYAYAANLNASGLLFPASTSLSYRINDTTIRSYSSGFRETNHIAVNSTDIEGKVYSYMSLYFDKQTGILVEYTLTEVDSTTPTQTITTHFVLRESNAWVVPEFPTLLLLPLLIVASTLTLVLFKRRRR